MRLEPLVGFFLLFYTYRISFYHFRPLRMLADTYFVLILIVFITCNILYTLFLNSMIPIYPKKCKKCKKSKKKGSGLRLYKKISLFLSVEKHKKRTISNLLLFAWGSLRCLSKHLKEPQVLASNTLLLMYSTPYSVRPEGSEKTTPNRYKFLTLNVNNYKDKH